MAVLLSKGGRSLNDSFHHILETYLSDIDCKRGIFIKPNIVFAVRPESGEITSPLFVKILITELRKRNRNIDIIIGEGVAAGCDPWHNFQVSGYAQLARELNVPLLDLNCVEHTKVPWKFGKLELPAVALERTYINLPILKPSSACVISGALKNQKGLLLPSAKKDFHRLGLHEPIAQLNAVVKPALTILDGSRFFGRNTIISGNNCGEIDATVCDLLGIAEPEHVQAARNARVFSPGFSVQGDKIKKTFGSARPKAKEVSWLGRLRFWNNPQTCTGCRNVFREMSHNAFKRQNLLAESKLLALAIKGAEVVMGSNPRWRKEYPTVICFGACTRRISKEGGYLYIPGCPPTAYDLNNALPDAVPYYGVRDLVYSWIKIWLD